MIASRFRRSVARYVVLLLVVSVVLSAVGMPVVRPTVDAQDDVLPENVSIPGTIQEQLGCPGNWQPECEATQLVYDEVDDLWSAEFALAAGEYEYKVTINNSWTENYGGNADQDGPNIALTLAEDTTVRFIYNHHTHWVADNVNHIIANVPGNYQDEIGCAEWEPWCLRSLLQDVDGDGIYTFGTDVLPAGDYEAKVALNESWDLNYGADGQQDGPNIPFSVPEDGDYVLFSFDTATNLMTITVNGEAPVAPVGVDVISEDDVLPENVSIPGTIQEQLGCPGNWQPECEATQLVYDEVDDLWSAEFALAAGEYEYKVAINNSWTENYGGNADQDGPNITLTLAEDTTVRFIYNHHTHWVADNVNHIIANVPGDYQDEIGCNEWEPWCLRSLLQDVDGDGIYTFATVSLPAGDYEAKVALNESWDLNYGADGQQDGPNIPFSVPEDGDYVLFSFDTATNLMTVTVEGEIPTGPVGNIRQATAHWVSRDTIAWNIQGDANAEYLLYFAADSGLRLVDNGIEGGEAIPLRYDDSGLSEELAAKFPHLANFVTLKLDEEAVARVPELLRGQVAVFASLDGNVIGAAGLQIPGVLDDLYTYNGVLGVTFEGDVPTLSVWAPTARSVTLHLFDDAAPDTTSTTVAMDYDAASGVWSTLGAADWRWKYYLYEVEVYAPSEGEVVRNLVTDPYSFSLAMNSTRSQIVDLSDPMLMPEGWEAVEKPPLENPEDIVLYELHIRDFSVNDISVPEELRGTFMAFTVEESNGMTHLRNLAAAGLTHLHLLPLFDIATINEDKSAWTSPSFEELSAYPSNSSEQQAAVEAVYDEDGFNWGYDPFHYTVPEGSYSTDPNGPQRIIEFRQMVMALNESGLRVVMDVVYNHTNASGQASRSVLDRIVPGYYHRLTENGTVANSTCCANTATEHNMMRKLMIDSVLVWATDYKVDGFRFDLMGHHMLSDMVEVREALDGLTIEADGVDGSRIYIYGEGWNFGEVQDNARGTNATQLNIGGTGIGVFNDRLRDAVRGGNPFGGYQEQGFATGLFYDPNSTDQGDAEGQRARVLLFSDQIRVGMAGNLRDYTFMGASGEMVTGADVSYNNSPAGYTLDPQENIVYISAHDNETWFDAVQYKMPADASVAERVRAHNVGVSIVMMSQGVPFFHAGIDMLRSKNFDRDSFNSGDWFNQLDFTYQSNGWGHGLPVAGKNQDNWPIMEPLLADENIAPQPADILNAVNHFQEMLAIRRSSPLFRLETAEDVQTRVVFHNTGPEQMPGVIVMSIADRGELADLDSNYDMIVVVVNATPDEVNYAAEALAGMSLELHPIQQNSSDAVVQGSSFDSGTGTLTVPGRTTAVFVLDQ